LDFRLFCQPDLGMAKVIEILIQTEKNPIFWPIFSSNLVKKGDFYWF
jgi:hypothetical protein